MFRRRNVVIAVILSVAFLAYAAREFSQLNSERAWFALQRRQLQTIRRLEAFPPDGWTAHAWTEAVVLAHNVWGNVIYHPRSTRLAPEEMHALQRELDGIVAGANEQTSFDCVDRVFLLLLNQGRQVPFIVGFHDEFRAWGYARRGTSTPSSTAEDQESEQQIEKPEMR